MGKKFCHVPFTMYNLQMNVMVMWRSGGTEINIMNVMGHAAGWEERNYHNERNGPCGVQYDVPAFTRVASTEAGGRGCPRPRRSAQSDAFEVKTVKESSQR